MIRFLQSAVALLILSTSLLMAATPDSLVVNGDFETDANKDGSPDGWPKRPGMSASRETGNTWLVLEGNHVSTSQRIKLEPEWWELKLTMRMRVTGVVRGNESWKNARLAMSFHDGKGKRVGEWPNVFNATGTGEWVPCEREYDVPWGAESLVLNPANFGAEGKVEFDDIRIQVARTRSLTKDDHPVPEGVTDVWDLRKAWRRASPTRERICINGLWRFMPVMPGQEQSPPADGEGWGWFKVPGIWPPSGTGAQDVLLSSWFAGRYSFRRMDQAWYRREVTIPADWKGRRMVLDFGMIQTHARVFVNGRPAAEVWFPGGRADVTEHVRPGATHLVSVLLTARPLEKESRVFMAPDRIIKSKASVKLKGITGDVYLIGEPKTDAISDVQVITSTRKGTIAFDVGIQHARTGGRQFKARVVERGKVVKELDSGIFPEAELADGRVTFSGAWPDAKLWDTDTPGNMYDAVVSVLDGSGTTLDESLPIRFGFRELWIEGRDLYLTGTPIHLRALHTRNVAEPADQSCLTGCLNTCRRMKEYGFNFFITSNYSFSPGEVGYLDAMFQAADETGMLGSFSLPHVKDFNWKLDKPDQAKRYRALTEWLIRRAQNHPSIIAYAMNHNATGYYGDQNPLKIDGIYSPDQSAKKLEYKGNRFRSRNRQQGTMGADLAKSIDPTRPVYHHQSGNLGDLHTVNIYLNWAPRQERSDWLEHWATTGVKPLFFVEWGLPHVSSWSSYRGPQFIWRCEAYQRIWDSEFAVACVGERAYRMTEKKIASMAHEEKLWARGKPFHWGHLIQHLRSSEENYLEVQSWFAQDNWRAHRTWGISAMLPWDQGGLWRRVKQASPVTALGRFTDLQRPGIVPDSIHAGSQYIYDRGPTDDFEATSLGKTFLRWNRPLLGYIGGGPDRFTDKAHVLVPGETVQKQLVVLNDTRRSRSCKYEWHLLPSGHRANGKVTVGAGQKALVPVVLPLPKTLTPGTYTLSAAFDFGSGEVQEDTFALDIVAGVEKPVVGSKIALFDPRGMTSKALSDLGVRYTRIPASDDLRNYDLLIIGREALSDAAALPGIARVEEGLKVLVFEQTADVLTHRLGFRINVHGMRTAFARTPGHAALEGVTDAQLRDWRGAATLTAPHLTVDEIEKSNPKWLWCGFENTRVWRCGTQGSVASVLIEKPPRGNWLPIIDCGCDLQYAPLLECIEGKGRVVFCQLDVTGRTQQEPTARRICANLLRYLDRATPPTSRSVSYVGGTQGEEILHALGVELTNSGTPDRQSLLVLGPGADAVATKSMAVRATNVLSLGLSAKELKPVLPGGARVKRVKGYSQFAEKLDRPEYAGVSNGELHWRTRLEYDAVQITDAPNANTSLVSLPHARGTTVLCQVAPWMFDYVEKPYLRTTYRRNLFLVSRLLANLGASFTTPLIEKLSSPPQATSYRLPSSWRGLVDRDAAGRDQGWWRVEHDDSSWQPINVPGTFESQRPTLADYNGVFWYRLRFSLPKGLTRKALRLYIGPVDDESWIWLNGKFLGEVTKQTNPKDYWAFPREYALKPEMLRWDGEDVLAVRVNDTYQTGGIMGTPLVAGRSPWLDSFYVQEPESVDDPYRYYRW